MVRYLIAIAITAIAIGALYRLSYIYDMGILRMYGSFGILIIGYLGTALIRHQQISNSHERVFQALKSWEERGIPLIGFQHPLKSKGYPDYVLITDRIWSVLINDMPNYGGGVSARGLIRLSLKRAQEASDRLAEVFRVSGQEDKEIVPVLLFTRRSLDRIPQFQQWPDVRVGNIEQLNEWLEGDLEHQELAARRKIWHQEAEHLVQQAKKVL